MDGSLEVTAAVVVQQDIARRRRAIVILTIVAIIVVIGGGWLLLGFVFGCVFVGAVFALCLCGPRVGAYLLDGFTHFP